MKVKLIFCFFLSLLAVNLGGTSLLAQEENPPGDSLNYLYDLYIADGLEYLNNKKYYEAKF